MTTVGVNKYKEVKIMKFNDEIKKQVPNAFYVVAMACASATKSVKDIANKLYSDEELFSIVSRPDFEDWYEAEVQKYVNEHKKELEPYITKRVKLQPLYAEDNKRINELEFAYNDKRRTLEAVRLFEASFYENFHWSVINYLGNYGLGYDFSVELPLDRGVSFFVYVYPEEGIINVVDNKRNITKIDLNEENEKINKLLGRVESSDNNDDDDQWGK